MKLCHHCEALVEAITSVDDREPRVACNWHKTPQLVADSARECVLCRNIWDVSLSLTVDQASRRYPGLLLGDFHISLSVRERLVRGSAWWASLDTEVDVQGEAMVFERSDLIGLSSQSSYWQRSMDGKLEAESRIALISEWLHECESGHPECTPGASPESSPSILPARLLEIPHASSGSPIRLVRTDTFTQTDQAKLPLRYATLSYCWGTVLPTRTTKSTLHQFVAGIPEDSLPKTFRDAVCIVRALGIRYLWIDALCILQDDGDDWRRESAKMMDVYSGSVLTIAASDARDSTGGCHPDASPKPEKPRDNLIFPVKPRDGSAEMTAFLQKSLPRLVQRDTHLNTRGWTFQERILSHRIVHCMDAEMHWECRRCYKTQAGHEAASTPADVPASRRWADWVEDYSDRVFTHPSDRPAAIYGVVRRHERMTRHKPLLGLWDATLARDLLWMRLGKRRSPALEGMPSWTWLACDAWTVMNNSFFRSSALVEDELELVSGQVTWTGEPFVSGVRDTRLRVRGPVAVMRMRTTEESRLFKPPYMEVEGRELDGSLHVPWVVAAQFDDEGKAAEEFEAYTCLLACTQRNGRGSMLEEVTRGFLIVGTVGEGGDGVGVYRRVGVGRYIAESSPFDHAVVEVMDLV